MMVCDVQILLRLYDGLTGIDRVLYVKRGGRWYARLDYRLVPLADEPAPKEDDRTLVLTNEDRTTLLVVMVENEEQKDYAQHTFERYLNAGAEPACGE